MDAEADVEVTAEVVESQEEDLVDEAVVAVEVEETEVDSE